jgi:hypothetical protein
MSTMKPLPFLILASAIVFGSLPTQARAADDTSLDLSDILTETSRALTRAIEHGFAAIQDHVEITADSKAGSSRDERSTQLRLRLFPKGKAQSDEQVGADTTFNYSLNPAHPHFNFGLRIVPLRPDHNPDDYI